MLVKEPSFHMDFSESAFSEAVAELHVNPEDATIWVPATCITTAYLISAKYNCKVIIIPTVLAKSSFCWGVASDSALYWSPGLA
jgi:hypothetical protein